MRHAIRLLVGWVWLVVGTGGWAGASEPPWIARGKGGMVASDSPEASRIGARVLAEGGNAFDAAVATSFALGVARPFSTGPGGGGFMVAYVAREKRFVALDFRETAPAAATPERYRLLQAQSGDGPPPSIYGGNAVAVPGLVAGMGEIWKRFGTRPWKALVGPAIRLAEEGFVVDEAYRRACEEVRGDLERWPELRERAAGLLAALLGGEQTPQAGTRLARPAYARGLRLLAEGGPGAACRGPWAEAVVRAVTRDGGVLTLEDLGGYRPVWREPLQARLKGYEVVTMPPPSSGASLVEALNIFQVLAEKHGGARRLAEANRWAPVLVHAFRCAFADRARWLGDPAGASIPVARLVSRAYAQELASRFGREAPADAIEPPDDGGTSHFCVADRQGNIVAVTETINGYFGSLLVAEPFGVVLNNEMDDFLTVPGQPNLYGLRQGEANLVGPGKRPLSSMCPTIVLRDGRPVLALGASGGPRIITAVAHVILLVMELDQPLGPALDQVRLHHQWRPDCVFFDREPPDELLSALQAAGEKISPQRRGATVQGIQFLPDGTFVGASDPRKGGRPCGVP